MLDLYSGKVPYVYLSSTGSGSFCLRMCSVAAAHVGSCCSSRSLLSRRVEEVEEDREGWAAVLLVGAFVVTGAVEVEGVGSKPVKRKRRTFRFYWNICVTHVVLSFLLFKKAWELLVNNFLQFNNDLRNMARPWPDLQNTQMSNQFDSRGMQ